MGVQGALLGAVGAYAVPQMLHMIGMDPLEQINPLTAAFTAAFVLPIAGGVAGHYYL